MTSSGSEDNLTTSIENVRNLKKDQEQDIKVDEHIEEERLTRKKERVGGEMISGREIGKAGKKKKNSTRQVSGHQASLIYTMVTRGRVILAEYTAFRGNFADICVKVLEELPPGNNRFSVAHGKYILNYLMDEGIGYMVLCDAEVLRDVAFWFLERVKDDFVVRHGKASPRVAIYGLQKEFSPKLREHIHYILDHSEEVDRFSKTKTQVAEVKGSAKQNIEKAMQHEGKLGTLQTKTELMNNQAHVFKVQGTDLQKKLWFENTKIKIIISVGFAILILVAIISFFGHPFN